MVIETRRASEAELGDLERIFTIVYRRGVQSDEPFELKSFETAYIGSVDGDTVFGCIVNDYSLVVEDSAPIRCAGIGAVAVLPEARQRGVGLECLRQLLLILRDVGYGIAALYPFSDKFYRKLGFATCGWRWQIKAPVSKLPSFDQELSIEVVDPTQILKVNDCYERFIRTLSGSSLRSVDHWKARLGKSPPRIYALSGESGVESYLWSSASEVFWGTVNIGEFAWSTDRGYRNGLSLMKALAINHDFVQWSEPPNGAYFNSYSDHGVEMTRSRPSMFRILNVEAMVSALSMSNLPFKLSIIDPLFKENCKVGTGNEHPEALSIDTLTQLMLGEHDASLFAKEVLKTIKAHLPTRPVCLMEFF